MIEIVESYVALKKQMADLINLSGYKNAFLAQSIGMPAPTFSVKKQRGNWTEEEMHKILTLIENDTLKDAFLLDLMRLEKKSTRYPIADLKAEFGWK